MFVRAKTVKGKKYAYLVRNKWKKGKVKQEIVKYLGKIVEIPDPNTDFEFYEVDFSKNKLSCFRDIISKEFLSRGFIRKRNKLVYEDLIIDLVSGKIFQKDQAVVLLLNGRYFYRSILNSLLDFFQPESDEERKGERLAKAFSDAGIAVLKEDFVNLYRKIYVDKSS